MYRMILNETSYFGAGCRETIAVEAMRRGFKKAFFVTDKDLIRFKVADKIIEVFEKNRIPYELFSDVKANPTIANVQNGVSAFKASGADFIVALGGGSSIDTAKGIGIVVNNPDFADVKSLEGVAETRHSHNLVSYSAERIRSSASSRLFWASRISIPERLPSIYRSMAISWFSLAATRFWRSRFSICRLFW